MSELTGKLNHNQNIANYKTSESSTSSTPLNIPTVHGVNLEKSTAFVAKKMDEVVQSKTSKTAPDGHNEKKLRLSPINPAGQQLPATPTSSTASSSSNSGSKKKVQTPPQGTGMTPDELEKHEARKKKLQEEKAAARSEIDPKIQEDLQAKEKEKAEKAKLQEIEKNKRSTFILTFPKRLHELSSEMLNVPIRKVGGLEVELEPNAVYEKDSADYKAIIKINMLGADIRLLLSDAEQYSRMFRSVDSDFNKKVTQLKEDLKNGICHKMIAKQGIDLARNLAALNADDQPQ